MKEMKKIQLSCEFFPPKTAEGFKKLEIVADKLRVLNPHTLSVTFGAGGSTQENTFKTIKMLQALNIAPIAPHLTCIGSTKETILNLIQTYKQEGFKHIVALRGDLPDGMIDPGIFKHASELIEFIIKHTHDDFYLYCAAYPEFHPESPNPKTDLNALINKFKHGAQAAITQYFFNPDAYLALRDELIHTKCDKPLIAGIMPITNYTQLARFSNMCGAEIPRWLRMRLERFGDDLEGLKEFGAETMARLCETLIKEDVNHFHFYTLNQAKPTLQIVSKLGLI